MKKSIALALALVMVMVFALTGCGSPKAEETETPAAEETTDQTSAQPEESEQPAEGKTVKAGFIYIGPADDGGFSSSHDAGRKAVEEELGIETVYKELVPEGAEVESVIDNMVDQGCNVIFGCSFGYMDYMEKKAADYPDVTFLHCSGYKSNDTNFHNYFGRIYQSRFLSGIAAGLATKSNQIGYVAAFAIPEVNRGLDAFALGVQSVNPEAKVEVLWTSDWVDATKAKEAAKTLIANGCDVIAQHQDATSPQQAAEEAGKFAVGYHCDMSSVAPKASIASAVWNWGPYYVNVVKSIMDGTFKAENYWGSMADGVVDIVLTDNTPEDAKAKIDEYKAKIMDGSWDVFTGPIKDNKGNEIVKEGEKLTDEQMLSIMWLNENVVGEIPEG